MSQQPSTAVTPVTEEPALVEKRISHEGFKLKCDKCKAGKELIAMKSTTKTVTIGGKPIVTKMDKIPLANIPAFSICDTPGITKCVPTPTDWIDTAEPTVNSEKFIPLVEHSEFLCGLGGGTVIFSPPTAKSEIMGPKKSNIIDKAQAKINGIANKAANMAKKVTEGVTAQIDTALDALKPIGQIFDNPGIQNMITGAQGMLDQANLTKEQIDSKLSALEQKVPELKSKISSTINGIQIPFLQNGELFNLGISDMDLGEQAFIGEGIQDSINALENYFNTEINTANLVNLNENASGDLSVPILSNKGSLESWLDQKKIEQENIDTIAATEYGNMTKQISTINKDTSFGDGEDSKKALSLLYGLYIPSQAGNTPIPDKGELSKILTNKAKDKTQDVINEKISSSKTKLNTKIQNEFNEKLQDLGYDKAQKKIDKAQEESAELQKDMDKAAKYLGRMDDFGGYIDSIKEKYVGKITGKYNDSAAKAGANLAVLNTSLDGLSFIADGLPPGDVVTWVKPKKEKNDNDENGEDDDKNNNGENGTAGANGDDNKEPSLKAYWGTPR